MTAWPAISSRVLKDSTLLRISDCRLLKTCVFSRPRRSAPRSRRVFQQPAKRLALGLFACGLLSCGDREGDLGRPAPAPPAEFGSAAHGLAPYTFALPPMPAGTVARSGGEPIKSGDPATWASPFKAPTAEDLARGRDLFRIYCAPCHGPQGHGDGPMAGPLGVTVRDLRDEAVAGLMDGEIYATITHGSAQMLGLRGLIAPEDRWLIVLGLRAIMRAPSAANAGQDAPPDSTPPAATP